VKNPIVQTVNNSHMKRILIFTFLLLHLTFLLSSCSPQKRLERLLKRYPELIAYDTVYTEALVPVPSKTAIFSIDYRIRDTMISIIGSDSIELTYAILNDSVMQVLVYVPPDTISTPVEVPVERIKYISPDNWGLLIEKIPYLALAIIFLLIGAFVLKKK